MMNALEGIVEQRVQLRTPAASENAVCSKHEAACR